MKLTKFAATSALVIAAMGVGAGTAYADPAPSADAVGYTAHVDGRSVVTVLDAGGFRVTSDGKFVEIQNAAGTVLQALPLSYRLGDREFSIAPLVEGRTLTLTPETGPAKAKPADVAQPFIGPTNIAALGDNLAVFDKLAEGLTSAVTVGSLIGTLVGAVIGCVAAGSTIAACPAAIATGAGVGGVVGTIVAGVPVLAYNGWQVYQTLNAAPAAPAPADG
ncbi:hypothetical protein ABI214_17855 [Prescottella soli]|uniref:DUF8020 domain-containing protein n=1 Tax=Prescottella soli TaxID=1543852 RepID=A0ABW9G0Q8_9NOCA